MIQRQFDARQINEVVNHPDVRPWVEDAPVSGKIDLTPAVKDQRNILLMGEYGGILLFYIMEGTYEVHTAFLPEGRGRWGMGFLRAGMQLVFTCSPAVEIVTRVPQGHAGAKQASLMAGMTHEFDVPEGCVFQGRKTTIEIYSIQLAKWAAQAGGMVERGAWLHQRLREEAARLGVKDPPHENDDNHNRYLGVAYEMAAGGNLRKAVFWYNRCAAVARHRQISLYSETPPIIKFDIGLLRLKEDGDIEVVPSC